jgi:hypothetical protein
MNPESCHYLTRLFIWRSLNTTPISIDSLSTVFWPASFRNVRRMTFWQLPLYRSTGKGFKEAFASAVEWPDENAARAGGAMSLWREVIRSAAFCPPVARSKDDICRRGFYNAGLSVLWRKGGK